MSKLIIKGGKPLRGSVRLGGAKNASFKLMIASLLADSESRLLNIPDIGDVHNTRRAMLGIGATVDDCGERIYCISPSNVNKWELPKEDGEGSRASSLFAGPLLSRFGKAILPIPGGDKIGIRPIDRHLSALESMGATIKIDKGLINIECKQLTGAHFNFKKNSHTGTEMLIMAGVRAKGRTVIENAAQEPEVDDLISFLVKCGARIRRTSSRVIEIDGVARLDGSIHKIMPDRNEAVSYACAALGTKGDVIIENAKQEHLKAFLTKVREIGGLFDCADYGIRFWYQNPLKPTDVTTQPHPGFMSDWQPIWTTLMTQAHGTSEVVESIFPNRFAYVDGLKDMGASIEMYNPKVANPDKFYNFNLDSDRPEYKHAIKINGPISLKPTTSEVKDIRNGATLVIAALISQGTSTLTNTEMIDRGYENFDVRLKRLGADIRKED